MKDHFSLKKTAAMLALGLATSTTAGLLTATIAEASTHSTMTVTDTGKITKVDSSNTLSIKVGKVSYLVKTNDMTHVKIDTKAAKFSALKVGETVTIKGTLEMGEITAATITEEM